MGLGVFRRSPRRCSGRRVVIAVSNEESKRLLLRGPSSSSPPSSSSSLTLRASRLRTKFATYTFGLDGRCCCTSHAGDRSHFSRRSLVGTILSGTLLFPSVSSRVVVGSTS